MNTSISLFQCALIKSYAISKCITNMMQPHIFEFMYILQASNSFTQAKRHFSTAIEPLEESHRKVVLLANEAESPECEHLRGLSTGRMGEILKLVRRSEMKVVFFGRTSNGKSTVINALLKSKVLPFGAGSTTTAICYIRGQDTPGEGGFVKCDDDDSCVVPVQVCVNCE